MAANWVITGRGPQSLVDAAIPDAKYYAAKVDQLRQSSGAERLIRSYDVPNGTVTVTALEHVAHVFIDVEGQPETREVPLPRDVPKGESIFGYEFSSASSFGARVGDPDNELIDIEFSLTQLIEGELVARNANGGPIVDLTYDLQYERYVQGGIWLSSYVADGVFGSIVPRGDWFLLPDPVDAAQASEFAQFGYRAIAPIQSVSHSCEASRYYNKLQERLFPYSLGDTNYYWTGPAYVYTTDGAAPYYAQFDSAAIGFSLGSAALHAPDTGFLMWVGRYDSRDITAGGNIFKFGLRDAAPNDVQYTYALLAGTTSLQPTWVTGHVPSEWSWNGSGTKAISVQYGITTVTGTGNIAVAPYATHTTLDIGLVEVQVSATRTAGNPNTSCSRTINVHNLQDLPPLAVNYDFFDQRRRIAVFLDPYISPMYEFTQPDPADPFYSSRMRALLIYMIWCYVDDSGNISAPFLRQPVWHGPWQEFYTAAELSSVQSGLWADWPRDDSDNYVRPRTVVRPTPSFISQWGYNIFQAKIVGLDPRAVGWALMYQVDTAQTVSNQAKTIYMHKNWGMWGEERHSSWKKYDLTSYTSAFNFTYTTPVDTTPPTDFVGALAALPSGYTPLFSTSQLFNPYLVYDLNNSTNFGVPLYYIIVNYLTNAASINGDPLSNIQDGIMSPFRVHPRKHFALFAKDYRRFPAVFWNYSAVLFAMPTDASLRSWMLFDHVEKVTGYDESDNPVIVSSTHYDIYNAGRNTSYQPGTLDIMQVAPQGVWVEP